MAFCDHCEGQRFDRARVLRLLRTANREARRGKSKAAVDALQAVLLAVRELDVPHMEPLDQVVEDEIVH